VAIKSDELTEVTNKSTSLLVIVQPDGKQPGTDRLVALANQNGFSVFITQKADQAADLLENLIH